MPNIRILFVGPGNKAYQCGDIFTEDNLIAAGYSPSCMVSRGDAEETEAAATAEFPIAEPAPSPDATAAPEVAPASDGSDAAQTDQAPAKEKAAK